MKKNDTLKVADFPKFAKRLTEAGYPVSGLKKDSLYVKYQGTNLSVYKTKDGYKVTPKMSWIVLVLLFLICMVVQAIPVLKSGSFGNADSAVAFWSGAAGASLVVTFLLFFILGGIYNAFKKKTVKRFCEEFK